MVAHDMHILRQTPTTRRIDVEEHGGHLEEPELLVGQVRALLAAQR